MVFLGLTDLDFSGEVHTVTTYCSVCGYPPSEYLAVAVCVCLCVCLGKCIHISARIFGFTSVFVIFSELMTSAEKCAVQKERPIIVWYFYWSKRVLKIQTFVFLWRSRSVLVSFVCCRNDSTGGHRVLVPSLGGRQMG